MANTYTLISSNVLASTTVTVTFSSIPSTYTDLVLRYSSRTANASADYFVTLRINGSSAATYSDTRISGNGSAASSGAQTNVTSGYAGVNSGGGATANTFGSNEIYIPNYAGATNKPWSGFGTMENNSTTSFIGATAGLRSNTDAITSVSIIDPSGSGFVSGSSFYLYGIKNS